MSIHDLPRGYDNWLATPRRIKTDEDFEREAAEGDKDHDRMVDDKMRKEIEGGRNDRSISLSDKL